MALPAERRIRFARWIQKPPRSADLGAGAGTTFERGGGDGEAMNRALVDRIANAVLYEGYILYPYRPSVKNRQRWTFGGLYPVDYVRAHANGEASSNQTECLARGTPETTIEAVVRFLHLTARLIGEAEGTRSAEGFRPVETLRVGGQMYHSWQE